MNGFTTLASLAIPTTAPVLKGTRQGMSFQEFSKAMKGAYKGHGYSRGQLLNIKWHDYKQNVLHLELNTSTPRKDIERIIQVADKVINDDH